MPSIKRTCVIAMLCYALTAVAESSMLYDISADETYYDNQQHCATFIGHVVATRPDSKIQGDKLILYFNSQNVLQRLICDGKPATYQQVLPNPPHQLNGKADRITYDPIHQQTWFVGHALVIRGDHRITGPYLTYQLKQSTLMAKGSTRQQTHIILKPDDVESAP